MLDDSAGSMFPTASPDYFTSVTPAQCEPAIICEENQAPMMDLPILDLPILVLSSKWQFSYTELLNIVYVVVKDL